MYYKQIFILLDEGFEWKIQDPRFCSFAIKHETSVVAITDAVGKYLKQKVKDGKITQIEADEILAHGSVE